MQDTNSKFEDFIWRLVESCVERHAPLKKLSKKQAEKKSKPWINDHILKLIKHRDKLFHKKKKTPSDHNIKCLYNLFRNRTTRELKKAKKNYYNNYFENNLKNMKKTWIGIKEIINLKNNSCSRINQLNYNGKKINSNMDMANAFNEFFTYIGPQLDANIPHQQRPNKESHYLKDRIPYNFLLSTTCAEEIIELIDTLDICKSSGPIKFLPIWSKLLKRK